jgi:hypothetical protein
VGKNVREASVDREGHPVSSKDVHSKSELVGFLGIGLDSKDDHHRVTCSEHFFLVGGSHETHERLQDTAIRFDEALERRGKRLPQTSAEEAFDLLREALGL